MREEILKQLDRMLERSLRSRKVSGTRLIILKALVDLGPGWHSIKDVSSKILTYNKLLHVNAQNYILEVTTHYPDLIETDISRTFYIKNARFKILDENYDILKKHIDGYIDKLLKAKRVFKI